MNKQRQSNCRRAARRIAVIVAVAMVTIAGSSRAAVTFIYANSASSPNGQRLYTINATTGAVMKTCLLQKGNGRGIVVIGNLAYYTVADSNQVFKADITTCADLGVAFSVSGASGLSTMASDGTNLWIGDYSGSNKAYLYSPTGTLIKTVALANCVDYCDGLEFFNGNLISNRGDSVPPYDIYNNSGTLLTPAFINATFRATGIAFDGTNFFVSDIFNQKLQVYDGTTGAFVKTITITGLVPTANLIEDLSVDYSQLPDIQPPLNPCCPPWNTTQLENMLVYQGTNGIAAPFTLVFTPTPLFNSQMLAYIDYLDALNPLNNEIVIAFQLYDAGVGSTPVPASQIGITYFIGWIAGFAGNPVGNSHFFNLPGETMQVNHWYQVHTFIYLQSGLTFFPVDSCATNDVEVRVQVQTMAAREGAVSPFLQIRMPDGRIVEKPLL
jgi:hypothetical protein